MVTEIKGKLKALDAGHPGWREEVERYLDEQQDGFDQDIVNDFLGIIFDLCEAIKAGKIEEKAAIAAFDENLRAGVKRVIDLRLRAFHAFAPIRAAEREHMSQIKYMIDVMWEQYVIRYNPQLVIEPVGDMTNDEIEEIELTLGALSDYCVWKTFTYEGILQEIRDRLCISEELGIYIAKRIDRDYRTLQINFLVSRAHID